MGMTSLGRKRLIAAPMMAAMLTMAAPTAAQAAGAPGTTDRTVATISEAPRVEAAGPTGSDRRYSVTIRTLDDIRGAIS